MEIFNLKLIIRNFEFVIILSIDKTMSSIEKNHTTKQLFVLSSNSKFYTLTIDE